MKQLMNQLNWSPSILRASVTWIEPWIWFLSLLSIPFKHIMATISGLVHQASPVWRSRAWRNWLMEGGTFRRCWRTARWRCRRTYLGQRTKRLKSRLGWMSWPASTKLKDFRTVDVTSAVRLQPRMAKAQGQHVFTLNSGEEIQT